MLPLCDRVLLRLREGERMTRELAQDLDADRSTVHRVLRGLEQQGVVEERPRPLHKGSAWAIAPGVAVEYRPSSLVVTVPKLPPPLPGAPCRAVSATGRPCRLRAVTDGLCFLHAPPPTVDAELGETAGQE